MNLSQLSDQALLRQTLLLVKREKEILSEILAHLEEVRRRRLFCDLGYGSLFQYCIKQLGYSEDQAYRRINALKLVKEFPSVRDQIAAGELSLSSLSVAQSLFKADQSVDKKEVLEALRNKSKREAEIIVRGFSTKAAPAKKELKFSLSSEQEEKWMSVRGKLAHCHLSEEQVFERLCDMFLAPKPEPKESAKAMKKVHPSFKLNPAAAPISAPPRNTASAPSAGTPATKNIPAAIKRRIIKSNRCENCGSHYALEIDHKLPLSLGGSHHPKNLRLLCRSCNQRAAIQILGVEKMRKYLE